MKGMGLSALRQPQHIGEHCQYGSKDTATARTWLAARNRL